jgi:hypothetical protein
MARLPCSRLWALSWCEVGVLLVDCWSLCLGAGLSPKFPVVIACYRKARQLSGCAKYGLLDPGRMFVENQSTRVECRCYGLGGNLGKLSLIDRSVRTDVDIFHVPLVSRCRCFVDTDSTLLTIPEVRAGAVDTYIFLVHSTSFGICRPTIIF